MSSMKEKRPRIYLCSRKNIKASLIEMRNEGSQALQIPQSDINLLIKSLISLEHCQKFKIQIISWTLPNMIWTLKHFGKPLDLKIETKFKWIPFLHWY